MTDPAPVSPIVLRRLAARSYASTDEAAADACRALRELLGMGAAYVSSIEPDGRMRVVASDDGQGIGLAPGLVVPFEDTFCARALAEDVPPFTSDAGGGPYADVPHREALGVTSYVMAPLRDAEGTVLGTLCGMDRGRVEVRESALRLVELVAGLLARDQELERARARDALASDLLARRVAQQAAVAHLGKMALRGADIDWMLDESVRLIIEVLRVDTCHILQVLPGAEVATAWVMPGPDLPQLIPPMPAAGIPLHGATLAAVTIASDGALTVPDMSADPRLVGSRPLADAGLTSALTVTLRSLEGPLGLIGAFTRSRRSFDEQEVALFETVANILATAITADRARASLRWRAHLHRLLTEVSTRVFRPAIPATDSATDGAIDDALRAVCGFVRAERACVALLPAEGGRLLVPHEWRLDGVDVPSSALWGARQARDLEWWVACFERGEGVHVPSLGAQPPGGRGLRALPGEERALLRASGVQSLIALPIRGDGALLGFVVLDTVRREGGWPTDVDTLLRPIGDVIGSAMARQRIAAELQASERRYSSVLDDVSDIVVRIDASGALSFVNQAWSDFTGVPVAETVGRTALEHVYPEDREKALEHMATALHGGRDEVREVRFLARDGGLRWMEVRGRAIFDTDGTPAGFSGALRDVTGRREAEDRVRAARDEAERARDAAEQASRAKSEFLSRMSHELRTPLNAILGFGQLLQLAELDGEDGESVELILSAGRHLLDLINEVLDVTRIEAGHLSLSLEPVALAPVVAESCDLVRTAAEARGISVSVGPRVGAAEVVADRQRLKQVLVNLLSNAVKYNRHAGTAHVDCEVLPAAEAPSPGAAAADRAPHGWLRVSVRDTGPGIPRSRLQDVFLPFERLGAEVRGIEGTGIGLSLTRTLAEAMGGRIVVDSVEGTGTTFSVDLPLAAVIPSPREEPMPVAGSTATDSHGARHTVVYVEDNPPNVTLVRRILARRPDVRLLVAGDGVSGLHRVREVRPDLVLLDLHLPELGGEDVLAALRTDEDEQLRTVPVVVVTADLTPGTERRLLAAGATEFLGKPLDVRLMLGILGRHLPAEEEAVTPGGSWSPSG